MVDFARTLRLRDLIIFTNKTRIQNELNRWLASDNRNAINYQAHKKCTTKINRENLHTNSCSYVKMSS